MTKKEQYDDLEEVLVEIIKNNNSKGHYQEFISDSLLAIELVSYDTYEYKKIYDISDLRNLYCTAKKTIEDEGENNKYFDSTTAYNFLDHLYNIMEDWD